MTLVMTLTITMTCNTNPNLKNPKHQNQNVTVKAPCALALNRRLTLTLSMKSSNPYTGKVLIQFKHKIAEKPHHYPLVTSQPLLPDKILLSPLPTNNVIITIDSSNEDGEDKEEDSSCSNSYSFLQDANPLLLDANQKPSLQHPSNLKQKQKRKTKWRNWKMKCLPVTNKD